MHHLSEIRLIKCSAEETQILHVKKNSVSVLKANTIVNNDIVWFYFPVEEDNDTRLNKLDKSGKITPILTNHVTVPPLVILTKFDLLYLKGHKVK